MIHAPLKDALPLAGGAGVKIKTSNSITPAPLDCGVVYALRAALVSIPARGIMQAAGADLFASRAERMLARMIVLDNWTIPADFTRRDSVEFSRLADAVARCTCPDGDDAWAVYLVRLQAERHHGPLLASELRWAAERVGDGFPIAWIRRHVDRALGIATGELPLDVENNWTGEAGEVAA